MINKIKDFFAFAIVGGGQNKPEIRNTQNLSRKEELRQEFSDSISNSDFNRKRGEGVLTSSTLNNIASKNLCGGGSLTQLEELSADVSKAHVLAQLVSRAATLLLEMEVKAQASM